MKNLFSHKLEKVSKDIFRKYAKELSELIGRQHGVYALYDEDELYYVGKAVHLKRRVSQHLKDRHFAQWTHFSLFLTSKSEYVNDIESVVIAISNPKGNKVKPRGSAETKLRRMLKKKIIKRQREEIDALLGKSQGGKQKVLIVVEMPLRYSRGYASGASLSGEHIRGKNIVPNCYAQEKSNAKEGCMIPLQERR